MESKIINGIECAFVNGNGKIKDFYIGIYEVTQAQYLKIMGDNPSFFKGDNLPVERVTWFNAADFCRKAGGRLPTETEWEFAAGGGNKSNNYEYGGSNDINAVAWFWNNIPSRHSGSAGYGTQSVGTKQPNELGIYDCSGNVWEWTDSKMDSDSSAFAVRGGCWYSDTEDCRISNRIGNLPLESGNRLGFRIVFDSE